MTNFIFAVCGGGFARNDLSCNVIFIKLKINYKHETNHGVKTYIKRTNYNLKMNNLQLGKLID